MNQKLKFYFGIKLTLSFFLFPFLLAGQSVDKQPKHTFHLGFQGMGLAIHTFKSSRPDRYDLRLDEGGFFVVTPGITGYLDWYYNEKQKGHFRLVGGYYKDSGFNDAAYINLSWRGTLFRHEKWELAAGLGPGFFMRENWNRLYENRVSDPFYGDRITKNDLYQYRFFPLAGEVNFLFKVGKYSKIDFAVIPAYPAVIVFKVGMRFKM